MLVRLTCTCIAAMGDLAIEYGGDTRAKGFGMRRGRGARGDGDGREEGRTDGRSVVFVVFVIHVNDARARDHSSNSEKKSMVERRASMKASTSAGVL